MSKNPEDEIEIEITEDDPEADVEVGEEKSQEPPKKEETEDPVAVTRAAVEEAERKVVEERQARLEAERRANEARTVADRVRAEKVASDKTAIESAIALAEAEAQEAEREYAAAFDNANSSGMSAAQRKIAAAEVKLNDLRNGRTAIEVKPEPENNGFETYVSQFSPQSQKYLREHPDYVTDATKNQKLITAHHVAVDSGLAPDSDEYFQFIDQKMTGQAPKKREERPEVTERPAKPAALPPSRDSAPGAAPKQRITLTKREADTAEALGMTPLAYWKPKQTLEKEGKLS